MAIQQEVIQHFAQQHISRAKHYINVQNTVLLSRYCYIISVINPSPGPFCCVVCSDKWLLWTVWDVILSGATLRHKDSQCNTGTETESKMWMLLEWRDKHIIYWFGAPFLRYRVAVAQVVEQVGDAIPGSSFQYVEASGVPSLFDALGAAARQPKYCTCITKLQINNLANKKQLDKNMC